MRGKINPDDLLILKEAVWPKTRFYDKQIQTIESVLTTPETYVVAGNKLGKDFIAGYIALGCFLVCQARGITCRIVTTSVAEKQMNVLWGEIGRFVSTAAIPLFYSKGGPLVVNAFEIRRVEEMEAKKPYNYLVGMVYEDPEKMAGHHAEFTLAIGDEASGLDDKCHEMFQGWAQHQLYIGNPNNCSNFFRRGVEAGDLIAA